MLVIIIKLGLNRYMYKTIKAQCDSNKNGTSMTSIYQLSLEKYDVFDKNIIAYNYC